MIVRDATLADVDSMARIRAAVWGTESYWQVRIRAYMQRTAHPRESLPQRAVFIAAEDGQVVGLIAGHLTRRFGCDGELQWLDVVLERRRHGVGAQLLWTLATWFHGQGARRLCVDVAPDNAHARAFYRKHGAEALTSHWLMWHDSALLTVGHSPFS